MKITRREFLNYCSGSAAALGLATTLGPLQKALAASSGPPIIWIKGSSCTGCTVSLANRISTSAPVDLADLLIHTIDLVYHPTLMGAAGENAVSVLANAAAGQYILAVEGGIPTIYNGKTCTIYTHNGVDVTALAAVQTLAPKASNVLAIGTCASFGGMAAASPNPTQIKSVSAATGIATINIPGCPPHPDWIVWKRHQLVRGNGDQQRQWRGFALQWLHRARIPRQVCAAVQHHGGNGFRPQSSGQAHLHDMPHQRQARLIRLTTNSGSTRIHGASAPGIL